MRVNGAGATHDLLQHLEQMNRLWRTVKFTVGWSITDAWLLRLAHPDAGADQRLTLLSLLSVCHRRRAH
ncbi:hypothetical protein [Dactylosporangium sp. NPDC048998]|uniref:hypothetical protein n=1 Tax=Dactylosporangium sp. NPDC048998 TaxID=3363976 RepID=UPI003716A81B